VNPIAAGYGCCTLAPIPRLADPETTGALPVTRTRLEAFSDAVLAIIITIMVLELKVPHEPTAAALVDLWPAFLSYLMSFLYVGIYWNNHHHLLHTTSAVTGSVLWANLHLLFWLSLLPFATAWTGENHFASLPTAFYGVVLLLASMAYYLLQRRIMALGDGRSVLARAIGRDLKGKASPAIYLVAIPAAFLNSWVANAMYVFVALMWLVPDRRIERTLAKRPS
jgi:uncharacterized membrane protein